jgi:hypothetical protein
MDKNIRIEKMYLIRLFDMDTENIETMNIEIAAPSMMSAIEKIRLKFGYVDDSNIEVVKRVKLNYPIIEYWRNGEIHHDIADTKMTGSKAIKIFKSQCDDPIHCVHI